MMEGYTNDMARYLNGKGLSKVNAVSPDIPETSSGPVEADRHDRQLPMNAEARSSSKLDCKRFETDLREVRANHIDTASMFCH